MKFLIALGGFAGFALIGGIGLFVGRDPAHTLLQASIAAVIGALLARWLHRLFVEGVNDSVRQRRDARIAATAETAMKAAQPGGPARTP